MGSVNFAAVSSLTVVVISILQKGIPPKLGSAISKRPSASVVA
jgi:hypothetical protein